MSKLKPVGRCIAVCVCLLLAVPSCSQKAVDDGGNQISTSAANGKSTPKIVRTDFSDDQAWATLQKSVPQFANVQFVDDDSHAGLELDGLVKRFTGPSHANLLFAADSLAFSESESTLLVVDLSRDPAKTFRCLPIGLFAIESNVSSANMSFDEFADAAQADGVFRGFSH